MNFCLSLMGVVCLLTASTSFLVGQAPVDPIPPLVDSLLQVSRAHTAAAEFDQAFFVSEAAGKAAKKCCGEESAAYAAYYFNEGRIRYFMDRNKEAIPWYVQSRELRGRTLGRDHVEYGKSCNNLAIVYDVLGRYEEAEPLYLEALAIREANAGRESERVAGVLANLGGMYGQMGDYAAAEVMITDAMAIRKRVHGEDHPRYAENLLLLAGHYNDTYNYTQAERLLLNAKEIYEQQERLDFYNYVLVLETMGSVYQALGRLSESKQHLTEAADLIQRVLGEGNTRYARSLDYLATVAFRAQDYTQSEAYIRRSLAILDSLDAGQGASYGLALQELARIYHQRGELVEALQILEESVEIIQNNYSPSHHLSLLALYEQATLYQAQGDYKTAANLMRRIASLEEKPLASAVRYLSNQELNNFTSNYRDYLSQCFKLAASFPAIADLCYDKILLYKGFLLNNALHLRRGAQKDEASQKSYRQLRSLHRQLAELYSQLDADQAEIEALEADARRVEKVLVRSRANSTSLSLDVGWQAIQAQLAPDEAALELAAYQTFDILGRPLDTYYAGLLLTSTAVAPIPIPLGSQAALDSLLAVERDNKEAINNLYDWSRQGQSLYRLTWQAVDEALEREPAIEKIYYASDGHFHRLNLAAIPTPAGKTLGQAYELVALTSTRSLLTDEFTVDTLNKTALLYGAINYGEVERVAAAVTPIKIEQPSTRRRAYNRSMRGYEPDGGFWQNLPWTEVEISYAEEVLQGASYGVVSHTGSEASEANFKRECTQSPSPHIVHLATHGYFFEPPENGNLENLLPFEQARESMIRSGLILADGNYAWVNGRSREQAQEDGILTALEISQMELEETELVILSACETGLGDIQATEGVFGLQRALKLAGVKYIIFSLWQVPDYQAQAFMSTFYIAWLDEGKTIPEAFQSAQTYMRARYKEAFDWAGFVLVR